MPALPIAKPDKSGPNDRKKDSNHNAHLTQSISTRGLMNSLKRNTGKHHMTALILTACILSGLALAVPVLRIKRALFG